LPYRITDPSPAGVAQVIGRDQPEPSRLDAPLDAILSKALSKDAANLYHAGIWVARYLWPFSVVFSP
jgi:hypothetical protein